MHTSATHASRNTTRRAPMRSPIRGTLQPIEPSPRAIESKASGRLATSDAWPFPSFPSPLQTWQRRRNLRKSTRVLAGLPHASGGSNSPVHASIYSGGHLSSIYEKYKIPHGFEDKGSSIPHSPLPRCYLPSDFRRARQSTRPEGPSTLPELRSPRSHPCGMVRPGFNTLGPLTGGSTVCNDKDTSNTTFALQVETAGYPSSTILGGDSDLKSKMNNGCSSDITCHAGALETSLVSVGSNEGEESETLLAQSGANGVTVITPLSQQPACKLMETTLPQHVPVTPPSPGQGKTSQSEEIVASSPRKRIVTWGTDVADH